jgi:formate dehydrogenase major subunit
MGMMEISKRGLLAGSGAFVGASTLTALGFSPAAAQSAVRPFKLERTPQTPAPAVRSAAA